MRVAVKNAPARGRGIKNQENLDPRSILLRATGESGRAVDERFMAQPIGCAFSWVEILRILRIEP